MRPPARPQLGGGWTLWPQVLVRGAGFEFARLDQVLRAADASAGLRAVAGEKRFREAVTWQNRAAVVDGLDSLLRRPAGASDSRTVKKELMVARYLQRYCAKNDTIGFFGPVGWGRWSEGPGSFAAGPKLVDARATFFEPWALRAVADAHLESAPVSLPPEFRLSARGVEAPRGLYVPSALERRVLARLAKGAAPKKALLTGLPSAAAQALASLLAQGVVRQRHRVAIAHTPLGKARLAGAAQRFEAARAEVAAAAGDAEALSAALAKLEAGFSAETARAARRGAGRTYAGRGLVYEECRRGVRVELGRAVVDAVAAPLEVLLLASRWYTFTAARRVARGLRRLAEGTRDLAELWQAADALFAGEKPRHVQRAAAELSTRWEKLWNGAETLDAGGARARAARLFRAPCPGWPGARHHAPDLMWAAPSAEALLAGEGTPVLAELHPGVNPLTTLSVLALCPDHAGLEREWRRDFPEPGISPVPWEDFARSSQDARLAREHFHLETGGDFDSDRPSAQRLRLSDFTVARRGERLVARHRARALSFDLLQVFERRLRLQAATAFSLAQPGAHVGRRWLGRLLVQRETWRFERSELPLQGDEVDRLVRFGAWRVARGLPDRCFVRTPGEVKPVYVDFQARVLVESLLRMLKKAERFTVQEMFPGPQGLWLADAEGRRYVSELRLLAVDPVAFDASAVWRGL